jgi:AraC-like DNA-binding protein
MPSLHHSAPARLERSCDWIRTAPACPGLERMEAFFAGHGFDPHRHDTYAIGYTMEGVQAFRYRGAARQSTPGAVFVLHPDEVHDGSAGTSGGFRYRILYVEPRLIHDALGRARLPFVREPVSTNRRLAAAIVPALDDLDVPLEDLRRDQIVVDLAEALAAAAGATARRARRSADVRAVDMAREFIDANVRKPIAASEMERVTGAGRYTLARHFRACLGTSPYRYLVMRRLDRARVDPPRLADAALLSGFADQAHLTRHFKRAYGVTPGRWAAMVV